MQLTRSQLNTLGRLSLPLAPADRRAFAELVLQRLQETEMIGDGAFYRLAAECQKQFWTPPGDSQLDKPALTRGAAKSPAGPPPISPPGSSLPAAPSRGVINSTL